MIELAICRVLYGTSKYEIGVNSIYKLAIKRFKSVFSLEVRDSFVPFYIKFTNKPG